MQAAESAASELQASTSFITDAINIPRQLESVNLDFSGASLLTITLHRSSLWWHGDKSSLMQAQPGILTIISCCIQLFTIVAMRAAGAMFGPAAPGCCSPQAPCCIFCATAGTILRVGS